MITMCLGYIIGIHVLICGCVQTLSTVENNINKLDISASHDSESTSEANVKYFIETLITVTPTNDEGVNVSSPGNTFVKFNVSKEDEFKTTDSVLVVQNNSIVGDEQTVHTNSSMITSGNNISDDYSGDKMSLEFIITSLPTAHAEEINTTSADPRTNIETTKHLQHKVTTVSPAPIVRAKTTYHMSANLPFHVPYIIHGQSGNMKPLFLDGSKRAALKHHLQLVPMEDEPLGAMMVKDQRYVISVLVPIAIGVLGAALIAGTVLSLRYIARRRAIEAPIDDDFDIERDQTPCIPSISGDTTDKVFLLMGDEE